MDEAMKGIDVYNLAEFMHNKYEVFAKEAGWKTQESCQVKFNDLPEKNKEVMVKMAFVVIDWFNKNQEDIGNKLIKVHNHKNKKTN